MSNLQKTAFFLIPAGLTASPQLQKIMRMRNTFCGDKGADENSPILITRIEEC